MKKEKIFNIIYSALGLLISAAIGFLCGYAILEYVGKLGSGLSLPLYLLALAAGLLALALAVILQILIHEGGHLIFGLISGYGFVSFRVGSLMLLKGENGRLSFKRYFLAGTAGQCLMSPPDIEEDGYLPVGLYNMGGAMLNAITSLLFFWAYYLSSRTVILPMFFLCLGIVGLGLALMNALPMKLSGICNDGYNALTLGKDEEALNSFWKQLKMNQYMSLGHRLKEMPEQWFSLSDGEQGNNVLTASTAVFRANRLLDQQRPEEAELAIDSLLASPGNVLGLYLALLKCDKLYLRAIKGDVQSPDKATEKFMDKMKSYPSVLRTRYALSLAQGDSQKAEAYKQRFQTLSKDYPYSGELRSEQELMELAESSLASLSSRVSSI